jgi:phenylacetate-coenzyme A ligase PaaK-like adenylate-forming protein
MSPVNDFQAVLVTDDDDLETLNVRIEVRRGEDADAIAAEMAERIKMIFEMSARIDVPETGNLARLF